MRRNSKIEILYLITEIKRTGPNKVLNELLESLDLNKFHPTVLSFVGRNGKFPEVEGVKYVYAEFTSNKSILTKGRRKLNEVIEMIQPDIIHSSGFLPDISLLLSKVSDSKRVSTVHNKMAEDYTSNFGQLFGKSMEIIHTMALKKYDLIIACSYSVMQSLAGSIPPSKLLAVQNGVGNQNSLKFDLVLRNQLRSNLGIPEDAIVFVYAGVMNNRKGVNLLVRLFKSVSGPNDYLLMVGDGNELKNLKADAASNIVFTGFVSNVNDFFAASDVYVSASNTEGLPMSVIEAMDYGNILLLSDIDSHHEICSESVGIVFDRYNFAKSYRKIISMRGTISNDEVFSYKQINFSGKKMSKEYQDAYVRALYGEE